MLIGELSRATGVSARMLRYYEQAGLLASDRGANGYRDYPASSVERVGQIRALSSAGLPSASIREVIPCARSGGLVACDGVEDRLVGRLAELDAHIAELQTARDELQRTLAQLTPSR